MVNFALSPTGTILGLIVSLIISTIIIFVVVKLLGETEGIVTAFLAALIGSIIYAVAYAFFGILASIIGGIGWLLALKWLYKIGWLKALLIAVIVWIIATIVSYFLPTVTGPL